MHKTLAVLLLCALGAPPAMAGAWLREHKTAFSAISSTVRGNITVPLENENSFYLEYGLTPFLTLGADLNEKRGLAAHALLFARLPLGKPDWRTRYAIELAAGTHMWRNEWFPMYKLAFAVGRGFETRWGNGWMALEAAYEVRTGLTDPAIKLDGVIGMSSGWRVRPLLKIETAQIADSPLAWAVTPGVMFDVGKSTWIIGLERRKALQETYGITFGFWRNF
jgi:hypothetical protein